MDDGRKLLKQRGYTEEGIKQIEEFRDAKGLIDYEDAVKLWEIDNPPPQVSDASSGLTMFDIVQHDAMANDFHKTLFESQGANDSVVEREALAAIREMRGAGPRR